MMTLSWIGINSVIASQPVGALRRRMTGSAKQSRAARTIFLWPWIASSLRFSQRRRCDLTSTHPALAEPIQSSPRAGCVAKLHHPPTDIRECTLNTAIVAPAQVLNRKLIQIICHVDQRRSIRAAAHRTA
jgi:hypothetical protein